LNSNHLRAGGKAAAPRTPRKAPRAGAAGERASVPRRVAAPRPAPVGVRIGWREAIAATVGGLGFELVDVERAQRGLLRVFIDRIAGRAYSVPGEFITVDDCEQVTRQLQYALEVEGLEYSRLEVSSPGLDRPLRTEADYLRFAGQAVQLTQKAPFQGRKSWQGVLTAPAPGADADAAGGFSLVFKDGKAEQVLGFKLEEVREARLVPVVDFKGRASRIESGDAGPAEAAPARADASGTDGG
jgi:ribosome maturation factor RimP